MANSIKVINEKCVGCQMCAKVCPFGAISMVEKSEDSKKLMLATVDLNKCTYCGMCSQTCKFNAIELKKDTPIASIDKSLYRGVLVYAEQRHGVIHKVSYELLNKGIHLAKELGTTLSVVLIGDNIKPKAQELINRGADKVYVCDDPIFIEFQEEPYSAVISELIEKEKPEIVLIGATDIGRSFAPRVAAKVKTGLTANCISLEIDAQTRNLKQTRPAFGGNIVATIMTPEHRPQMATVRHKVFKETPIQEGRTGEIIDFKIDVKTIVNRTKFLGFIKDESTVVSISDADIVIAGGRGVGSVEGFKLLKELADLLGGALGASRPAVDYGWLPYSHQIGQTGKTVSPKIYIACGISGNIQHTVGINADIIVAINKDSSCSMMQTATYALEGDIFEIVPNIIKEIKAHKCNG
ncbi:MAG: electron transfer flavoprotein subunit alpha [Endomicrobium sp.]|jgi:electron transfer flavoprotein alpha subunit|nr:electron transfer flavoprotein subunit alpha [Endomicrobium sp.]